MCSSSAYTYLLSNMLEPFVMQCEARDLFVCSLLEVCEYGLELCGVELISLASFRTFLRTKTNAMKAIEIWSSSLIHPVDT